MTNTSMLVIDVGTTSVRAAIVDEELRITALAPRPFPPSSPAPGLVEFDAAELAAVVLDAAREVLAVTGEPVRSVGITTQRASTIVWDRATGQPVGPALGWQDLRTVMECIMAKAEHGLALAPNQTAPRAAWLLDQVDGGRERDLCIGTVDSWVAWTLTGGAVHATDHTNAAVTGLLHADASGWNERALEALRIPAAMLPTVVDSSGVLGAAVALAGAPPIAALVGDQQASLVGQGCVVPGRAKITFGTGGMLDMCRGPEPPASSNRATNGTFPIVAWSHDGALTWGVEAIMLSAGTNVEWLRDDLGVLASSAESHDVAASVPSADGVVYVPALLGLGTPQWDYGARGTLLGITRGTTRAHVVRAVLEGVAQRGADLVEAAVADTGVPIGALRVDGGMSENPTFTQALADATGRPVEVSPVVEATTLGAGFLAGLASGVFDRIGDAEATWRPARIVEPGTPLDRAAWGRAVERAGHWLPELSALDF
ncbi:MAG: FGGY family carbohydrate kinase [Ilumatobacteraceae bacterium]